MQGSKRTDRLIPHLNEALSQCPNVTDLAIWTRIPRVNLQTLLRLSKLTHLSMDAAHLCSLFPGSGPYAFGFYDPPLFPNVTHLCLLRTRWTPNRLECQLYLKALAYHFPGITHLAHNQLLWLNQPDQKALEFTLEVMKNLEVFVLRRQVNEDRLCVDEQFYLIVRDERIVPLITRWDTDWEREARGTGLGMWKFADRVVEERKKRREMIG